MHARLGFEPERWSLCNYWGPPQPVKLQRVGPDSNQLPIHCKSGRWEGGDESVCIHMWSVSCSTRGFLQKFTTMRKQPSQLIMAETSGPSHLLMWKISQRSSDGCLFKTLERFWSTYRLPCTSTWQAILLLRDKGDGVSIMLRHRLMWALK